MNDKTKTSFRVIPITRACLGDLCQAIEKELEKISEQDRCFAIYEIIGKRRQIQSHDSKSFLAYDIPVDIGSILLRLQTPHRRITVKMSTSINESYVIVEGSDPNWVHSTTVMLEKIVEIHKPLSRIDRHPLLRIKSLALRLSAGGLLWAAMLFGNSR